MSEYSTAEPELSTYRIFSHQEWARLRTGLPLPISTADLGGLVSLNDTVSLEDVGDIYMPLVRLLQIHIAAARHLYEVTNVLLGAAAEKVPYVIGVAGSVAVGKSTTARILQHLLAHTPSTPRVDLVTTDGFL